MNTANNSLKQKQLTHPKYRPDIDGLRAVAVLMVVAYHAFPTLFKGGFIGVDIFYVISGFLISTIIFENLKNATFSFAEFYRRRIKRIFPVLLLVILSCLVAGWYLLLVDEFQLLGKHVAAGIAYISNLVLWQESGYFDTASDQKPLLHLWSLGIEEQFYILWPFLLWLSWRNKLNLLLISVLTAGLSFGLNILMMHLNPVAAFYAPYCRFWELLTGSLWAYHSNFSNKATFQHLKLFNRHLRSISGLVLLALGFLLINREQAFPGWWALLPTLGTVLCISAGPKVLINRYILANPVMVWFGLISYPLYLWHWPVLVFLRIVNPSGFVHSTRIIAVAIAILLAWLSYKFLEKPIRSSKSSTNIVWVLIFLSIIELTAGLAIYFRIFQPRNNAKELQPIFNDISEAKSQVALKSVKFENETFNLISSGENISFLLGDSHIQQYIPRVDELIKQKSTNYNSVYFAIAPGCPPIPNVFEDNAQHLFCTQFLNSALKFIENSQVKVVVIGACWNCYFIDQTKPVKKNDQEFDYYHLNNGIRENFRNGRGKELALLELKHLLEAISKTKKVYLLLDNPFGDELDPKYYISGDRLAEIKIKPIVKTIHLAADVIAINAEMAKMAADIGVEAINPTSEICLDNRCPVLTEDNQFIYKDNNHLRPSYIRKFATYLDSAIVEKQD
ncbi:acyltransferase [Methylomonas paludis]|uniref:Acyltransferase n=1 Tax=Methylomonas paludis TaxID=1173101 RepID=A0A975R8Q1_9GAMM|nr:acyltransferase family protein [Methylomonas paludis]QWF69409.1 acyltransferase [Methylomonas paludis]